MGVPGAVIQMAQISDLAIRGSLCCQEMTNALQCVYPQKKAAHEKQEITKGTG